MVTMNGLEGEYNWGLVVLGLVLLEYLGVLGQVTSPLSRIAFICHKKRLDQMIGKHGP